MKTEEEIKREIAYLEGYIEGQRNSIEPSEKEIIYAQYEMNKLNWVLESEQE
jgi:hypothetical protein